MIARGTCMSANAKTPAVKVTPPGVDGGSNPGERRRKARFDTSPYLFYSAFRCFLPGTAALPGGVQFNFEFSGRHGGNLRQRRHAIQRILTQYQAALADPVFWRALIDTIMVTIFSILFRSPLASSWRCSSRSIFH